MEDEYQDLSLDCTIGEDAPICPADRDVHDVGSWEEQPNGNILMSIDRYHLRKHLFLNGGTNRAKKMNSHSIYAFFGKFFAVVKVWKKDGFYSIIEFKELDISFVAREWVMLTLWLDTPCLSEAAINRLWFYLLEKIENRANNIISIGDGTAKKCYFNISKWEAVERYLESEGMSLEDFNESGLDIHEFDFEDYFTAYTVYPPCETTLIKKE